jgi:parallel beta-helix repeat protein
MSLWLEALPEAMAWRARNAGCDRTRRRLVPELARLEKRELLSTFDVTSTADDGSAGTLRQAIAEANAATSPSTIDFQLGSTPATITLTQGQLSLSNTSAAITIDGPGADLLSISGNHLSTVMAVYSGVTASLSGLTITGGAPSNNTQGAGLFSNGTLSLNNCTIAGNSSNQPGGGLETLTLPGSGVASATLTDCTISGNSSQEGGGAANYESNLTLINCTISGNSAATAGGLWSSGGLPSYQGKSTLINCTISGNTATGRGGLVPAIGSGGGVYNTNPVTLTDCTISGNTATNGGGLYCNIVGRLALTDCTISGNTATNGGGLYFKSGTTTAITACTISGNTASGSGGGIYVYSGQYRSANATLIDTIVAGNTGTGGSASDIGGNGAGSGTSGSYNLTGTGGSGGITNGTDGNIVLTSLADLDLGPMANNGGPTETMALLPGSPAIGAGTTGEYPGTTTPITTDQRGQPLDSPPDIGAYQVQNSSITTFTVTSTADDGSTGTLRWAVEQANAATSPTTIDFDLGSSPTTITLTQGQLELSNAADSITIDGPGASLLSISGNSASRVFQVDGGVTASVTGLTITAGSATGGNADGGGIYNQGDLTLSDSTISGNSATGHGGGLDSSGGVTLAGCTISGNSAYYGGGLSTGTTAMPTLTDCTISGNSASGGGGGLDTRSNTAALTGCTISGNSAKYGGGLLDEALSEASLTLTDCTISGNSAMNGGGLFNGHTTTLIACTISGNSGGGIYNSGQYGRATYNISMTDTIVVENSTSTTGGSSTDIGGLGASNVTGTYNLIGTGGSGGITNGTDGNIVLTNLSGLKLGPLADNGGPTETMALLPGSPAIGAGTAFDYPGTTTPITTDQRGQPLDSPPDIGAYQTQTQTTHPISLTFTGLTSPSVTYGTASVTLSGRLANGDQAPPDTEGVQVTLDGITQSATLGAGGEFSTTFDTSTLSAAGSPYTTGYSYAGDGTYASTSASGALTLSRATPLVRAIDVGGAYDGSAFSATATITGVAGSPASQLEGVSPVLVYFAGSTTNGNPLAGAPIDVGTYTVVANFPGSSDYSSTRSAPVTFVIEKGMTTVAISTSGSQVVFGQSVSLVATVTAGAITPGGTVTFYDGTTMLGTVALSSGKAMLTTSALAVGSHSITAGYGGGADLQSATSGTLTESVAMAATHVVLVPRPTFRKKKLVSLKLEAEVLPALSGAGVPTGMVTFEIPAKGKKKPKLLGEAVLNGGSATLTAKLSSLLNKRITAVFAGDAGFVSSTATPLALTQAALKKAAASV